MHKILLGRIFSPTLRCLQSDGHFVLCNMNKRHFRIKNRNWHQWIDSLWHKFIILADKIVLLSTFSTARLFMLLATCLVATFMCIDMQYVIYKRANNKCSFRLQLAYWGKLKEQAELGSASRTDLPIHLLSTPRVTASYSCESPWLKQSCGMNGECFLRHCL